MPGFWERMRLRVALRFGLLALIPAVLWWLYDSGLYAEIDVDSAAAWLRAQGAAGALLFILACAIIQPMHISIYVFLVTASLVWTPPVAFAVAWCGVMASALSSYLFARFIARGWVQSRLSDRIRSYEDLLITHPFRTTLTIRVIFFTTPLVQMMFGVTRVPLRPFLLGTMIGTIPQTAFGVLVGEGAIAWLRTYDPTPSDLVILAALAGCGALAALLWKRREKSAL